MRGAGRGALVLPVLLLLCLSLMAHAAGPRWVAGSQWTNNGKPMNWYRPDVQYFVDGGALSASVDHAAAVALVDAAAAVWNLPNVAFTLMDGGSLAEDVNSGNVYLGTSGPIWPADVQSSSYASKQIAVVLDADGSITEMLLGSGASDPANCRQNAVTENTDLFIQPGKIAHALVVVNGRCSGPAAEQQLQLRYQLMRVFGRVIGLGWSQTNDNVFTGAPAPTYLQQLHWPIMHPIDIVCGPYTYQCLPQPFTLRDDDVAAMALVCADSWIPNPVNGLGMGGAVTFSNGMGMNGVNMTVKRASIYGEYPLETFQDVSAVTGFLVAGDIGNPVTGALINSAGTQGSTAAGLAGKYQMYGIPSLLQFSETVLQLSAEAINPLYVGAYAIGPYRQSTVLPSGSVPVWQSTPWIVGIHTSIDTLQAKDGADVCNGGWDGTESAPAPLPVDGVWSGRLCGVGHSVWSVAAVQAGRTATLEVTATDENDAATVRKARPLIGVWHASDATGTLPTMSVATAFNASSSGMTQLRMAFGTTERVRIAVSDQRGDGRPDYTYRARLLYADSVQPAQMAAAGGAIRIVGTGFQPGNTVTVGGVVATVVSLSATEIDAVAPALGALGGRVTNDVTVTDLRTGGTATIAGGLTYGAGAGDEVAWGGAPAAAVNVGVAVPLSVRVVNAAGQPSANAAVTLSVTAGNAVLGTCSLSACTLVTDAGGVAQTTVTAKAVGVVALRAALKSGSAVTAGFTAMDAVRAVTFLRPAEYVAAGAGAVFAPGVMVTGNGVAAAGQGVDWTAASARVVLASQAGVTGADGLMHVAATGSLREGEATTVQACAWTTVCVTQSVVGVAAAALKATAVSGEGQSVPASGALGAVVLRVMDAAGHSVAGAAVQVYQVVTGWQPPCAVAGRCAVAPVYGKANASLMSDDDGLITVMPLQYSNTAAMTKMTATVGTQGVLTVTLQKKPVG